MASPSKTHALENKSRESVSDIQSIDAEPPQISVLVDNKSTGKIIEDKRYSVKNNSRSSHKYNNSDLGEHNILVG